MSADPTREIIIAAMAPMGTQQPEWVTVAKADNYIVQSDKTGVYGFETEIAQGITDDGPFELYRYSLDRLKWVDGYLVPIGYESSWPYNPVAYRQWFDESLKQVAEFIGETEDDIRKALTSDKWQDLSWAYEAIGDYHGFANLDAYPRTLTAEELEARWSR